MHLDHYPSTFTSDLGEKINTLSKCVRTSALFLLLLVLLLSNACDLIEPPSPPPTPEEIPPTVSDIRLEQIDRGFKISWTRLDSSMVDSMDVVSYKIYRTDHDADSTSFYKEVETNVDSVLDVDSFNWPADSGEYYSYEIRSKNVDGIEGYPAETGIEQLVSKPLNGSIVIIPSEGSRQTLFTLNAVISTPIDSSRLEVRWDLGGNGIWDYGFSNANQVIDSVQFSESTGDILIVCEVRDAKEEFAPWRSETNLHINIPPTMPSIEIPEGPFYRRDQITVSAICSDEDDPADQLAYRWVFKGDTLEWNEPGDNNLSFQEENLDSVSFKVQSKDSWEETSPWSNTSTIRIENKPPIVGFTISPDSVGIREDLFTFCTTSDLTSDEYTPYNELLVQWRFKADTAWTDPDNPVTVGCISHSYNHEIAFSFNVSLKVTDTDGASTVASRLVRINRRPNQPTLATDPDPPVVNKGESITFTATASDPDDDELMYFFDYGDGDNSGWTSQIGVSHAYENSGSFDAQVITRDTWGDSSDWSSPPISIDVNNRPPNPPSNPTVSPAWINKNTAITVSATLSDPDGDNVKLCAQWGDETSSCGNFVPSGSSGSVTKSNGYSSSGSKSISLSTKDVEEVESSPPTILHIAVYDRNPNKPGFCISLPTTGYTCEPVSFEARSYDPDGDQVQITVEWDDGSSDQSDWVNSGQCVPFSHSYYSTGTKTISLYAVDKDGAGSGITTSTISIDQRPPDINNPEDIYITYPSSSGTTTIRNNESNICGQTLTGTVQEYCAWLSVSPTTIDIEPGQSTILTATVTSWSSFDPGETKSCTLTINSNDPDEQIKTLEVYAYYDAATAFVYAYPIGPNPADIGIGGNIKDNASISEYGDIGDIEHRVSAYNQDWYIWWMDDQNTVGFEEIEESYVTFTIRCDNYPELESVTIYYLAHGDGAYEDGSADNPYLFLKVNNYVIWDGTDKQLEYPDQMWEYSKILSRDYFNNGYNYIRFGVSAETDQDQLILAQLKVVWQGWEVPSSSPSLQPNRIATGLVTKSKE